MKAGSRLHAHQVLDKLTHKNSYPCIKGYVNSAEPRQALTLYHKMRRDGLQPDAHTCVALLKACATLRDLERGHSIYLDIIELGLPEKNVFIASAVVDMYAKCGALSRAQDIFDKLPFRDVFLWTILIQGYVEHGLSEEALKCFTQMQDVGVSPDSATLVCISKTCVSLRATAMGLELHSVIAKRGLLEDNYVLGGAMVDMYAKLGMLAEAKVVFDIVSVQDVVSWTAVLAGFVEHGHGSEALGYFEAMLKDSVLPSPVTFVCSLKACGNTGAEWKGRELHARICGTELDDNIHVGSALVDMYVKCGSLTAAQEAFDRLTIRNIVSLNALLAGYTEHGLGEEALKCFDKMQEGGISPDSVTCVCSIKACSTIGDIDKGREIHTAIVKKGLENDLITGNTLIDFYVKCGSLEEAEDVFAKLPFCNVVSWTALLTGYIESNCSDAALSCLDEMRLDGISPTAATFVCSLKCCSINGDMQKGRELHGEISMLGLEKELLVGNTLVDLYATCGLFMEAFEVFDELPVQDVVGWNAFIAGFVEHGCNQEALNCMKNMQHGEVSPDAVTFLCSLKACCRAGASEDGKRLHAEITKHGLPNTDASLYNSLVAMYAKCGLVSEAEKVYDSSAARSVVAWNSIIAAYTDGGYVEEALKASEQMEGEGIPPDHVTFVCRLKACGSLEAIERGREVHSSLVRRGMEAGFLVANTLVFMYAKCGLLATAQRVFDKLLDRDVFSWTALLAGYAQAGESDGVFSTFDGMLRAGIRPDLVTFGSVLCACSYSGLVEQGQMYFEAMCKDHGLIPTFWHHVCTIDLLGRSGGVEKAAALTEWMPFHPGSLAWHIVLGACRKWGRVELGFRAFKHALQEDEEDGPACVCMCNIYREAAMLEDAKRVKAMVLGKQPSRKLEPDWSVDPNEDVVPSLLLGLSDVDMSKDMGDFDVYKMEATTWSTSGGKVGQAANC